MQSIKCVSVGDGTVGKATLIVRLAENRFFEGYLTGTFENFDTTVMIGDKPIQIVFCVTAGQEDYDRLRPLAYPKTDVVLICFSLVSLSSFENIKVKWIEEIRHYCPTAPVILIGTKLDLRNDKQEIEKLEMRGEKPITYEEGLALANKIKAVKYFECSALTQEGLDNMLVEITRVGLTKEAPKEEPLKKDKSKCVVL